MGFGLFLLLSFNIFVIPKMVRKIIHIDMDAFFASVEQRDNPEYRAKPIAVGGSGERSVVAAASYEARKYGVFSAMPSKTAKKKCPFLIFVYPRFEVYKEVSNQIRQIFFEYTDLVEPLSLDEAFLDVTSNKIGMPSATLIAKEIKERIYKETGLTASAGISINKFLAKIASDYRKPNGIFLIKPEEAESFVEKLPVEKFFGVGRVTTEKMKRMGIYSGLDLKRYSEYELIRLFGKTGSFYFHIARAVDNRKVEPYRVQKSLGAENTFDRDLDNRDEMTDELKNIAEVLFQRMNHSGTFGKTVTIKIKFNDFKQITRSKTFYFEINTFEILWKTTLEIFNTIDLQNQKVRLLGISLSGLTTEEKTGEPLQLTIDF
ncbi:MAG: DNA polymerase IV [Bacteroidales bacterium]